MHGRRVGLANRGLVILGCVALGCSAPPRSRGPSLAETAPRSETAAPSESDHPSKSAPASESATLSGPTETNAEPASHGVGCGSDAGVRAWLGSNSAPEAGWWKPFSLRHRLRTKPVTRGGWAPIADLQIFGVAAASNVLRVQQSWTMGEYKLCYREALYKQLALPGAAGAPPLQGDWVARFTQHADRICAVEVVETSLPSEVSDCLRNSALQKTHAGPEEGQFEIVLVFRAPYTLPPANGRHGGSASSP